MVKALTFHACTCMFLVNIVVAKVSKHMANINNCYYVSSFNFFLNIVIDIQHTGRGTNRKVKAARQE